MNEVVYTAISKDISVLSGYPFQSSQFTHSAVGKPLIRIRDLTNHYTDTYFIGEFDSVYVIKKGDILIGMDGDFAVVRWKGTAGLLNQRVCKVTSTSNDLNESFIYWWLQPHIEEIHRRTPQTTVRHLPVGDILRIQKPSLSFPQQSFAAVVLDAIDEVIAEAEAVLAKLKQIRAGLLHDLLTCGLDESGQLRDPIAHPEQFKDSPLGLIPRDWEPDTLHARLECESGLIQTGPFGSQLHAKEYSKEGVPVIMPQDIREGDIDDSGIARIPKFRADELRRHRVRPGDIVFARRGDLSRCAVILERELGWLCGTGCLLMRCDQRNLSAAWLSLSYRHNATQKQIAARAVGTTMVNLNTTLLSDLFFTFPTKDEQDMIASRISASDEVITQELKTLSKLNALKSGLMDDLLTGRVRVPGSPCLTAGKYEKGVN